MAIGYKVVWRSPSGFEPCMVSAPIRYQIDVPVEMGADFGAFTVFDDLDRARRWKRKRTRPDNHSILRCDYEPVAKEIMHGGAPLLFYQVHQFFTGENFDTGQSFRGEHIARVNRAKPLDTVPLRTKFAAKLIPRSVVE